MNSLLALALVGILAVVSAFGTLVGYLTAEIAKEMFVAEARTRLERLPLALLWLVRNRLPAEYRRRLHDEEWLPELQYVLRETEGLPLTRLLRGLSFSFSLYLASRAIARELTGQGLSTARTWTSKNRLRAGLVVLNATLIAGYYIAEITAGVVMLFVGGQVVLGILAALPAIAAVIVIVSGIWLCSREAIGSLKIAVPETDAQRDIASMWSASWWEGDTFGNPWTRDYRSLR